MSEREKQVLTILISAFCKLSKRDKGYIIGLGDGIAMKMELEKEKHDDKQITAKTG